MVASYNPIIPSFNNDGVYCVMSGRHCVSSGHESINENYIYFIDVYPPNKKAGGLILFLTVVFIVLLALFYKYIRA